MSSQFLPPAYVVRREGNSFTLLVCPQGEGGQVSQPRRGGGGGSGQSAEGGCQVSQPTGGGGGVSILHPLAGGMPLVFTQDFLVCFFWGGGGGGGGGGVGPRSQTPK